MIATLLVAWIVFTILVKAMKTTANTAFIVAVSIVLLEAGFGISPPDIWNSVMNLPKSTQSVTSGDQ
ncbi:hypothetical protein F7734_46320 [Scytonema sp. UIC 10036]|uniref:hypothetical protein n=1 Tax=Scytonema sp. UIC 10036 TaxID=2304196 RepID=UPI0012DAE570|nr:hypothetical protein [Scytonema sp. UIC 10036]MUG99312.1 hypothetical protein [Scytonema sp. UIC 10036]